ncbi:MAG: 50S ribosomal protein L11 methyltransferase [Candidatus Parcubacteria bacterium]|nr:50S ribosomal protein L11 methyltransferase [Burkholderiales bacterium]
MAFVALRFDVSAAEALAWSDALLEAGALSVDVSDPFEGTSSATPLFDEPGASVHEAWQLSRVVALLSEHTDARRLLVDAAPSLALPVPVFETYSVEDQDWVRATQSQFGPIEIAPHFYIVPSWSAPPEPSALNLRLDPGLAFGTGSHVSTRLVLGYLERHPPRGKRVLDYGCGSGILAIVAGKLGAGEIAATDIDPQALATSAENAAGNGVAMSVAAPEFLPPGAYDLILANILAGPLISLEPLLASRTRPGGHIVLSGILESQAEEVAQAYARDFDAAVLATEEGWAMVGGRRR